MFFFFWNAMYVPEYRTSKNHSVNLRPRALRPSVPTHLVQNVGVEVGHVALLGDGPVVVVPEMFLQCHGVVGEVQHRVQVVGQNLGDKRPEIRE